MILLASDTGTAFLFATYDASRILKNCCCLCVHFSVMKMKQLLINIYGHCTPTASKVKQRNYSPEERVTHYFVWYYVFSYSHFKDKIK